MKLTLPQGSYDTVKLEVHTTGGGSSLVSSGTATVSLNIDSGGTERNVSVTGLSPTLTPGVQYTVTVSTGLGGKFSNLSVHSNPATVGEVMFHMNRLPYVTNMCEKISFCSK